MNNIIIDKEFKSLLKPLEPEEYQQLEQSIIAEGCRDALVMWGDILVDGHNRYEICTQHGVKFETIQKHFDSYDDAKVWMIDNQLARRNLTDGWRLEYAMNKKELLLNIGQQKREETQGRPSNDKLLLLNNNSLDQRPKHNTRNEIASSLNWSPAKVAQAEVVRKEAPEIWNIVKQGDLTIGGAYREIKKEVKEQETKAHVSLNSGDNEWYTPEKYINAAIIVMGYIDLDPASTELANSIVRAKKYYTAEENGLNFQWHGKVWMNPPYDRKLISDFTDKLLSHYLHGDITEAMVLINNATETKNFQRISKHSSGLCLIDSRVKFWHPRKISAPLQGQVILYLGNKYALFRKNFEQFGDVWGK